MVKCVHIIFSRFSDFPEILRRQLACRPHRLEFEVAIYGKKTKNFETFLTMYNTLYVFFTEISNREEYCSNLAALCILTS